MRSPSVSVVVATYNYGRFLAGALDSALGQTFRDLEVIVVDDGSTDDTKAVVAPYLADPRIRYHLTHHVGQPAAKNIGIGMARAPLIAFLDADDLWLPRKLEKQVELLEGDPALGVVYCRRILMDESGTTLEYEQPELHRGRILDAIFRCNFVPFSSVLVRWRVFQHIGTFDASLPLAIDYDLWLRVAAQYGFDYVNEPLVKYRTGHANLSQRTEERLLTVFGIMQRFRAGPEGRRLDPAGVRAAEAETCYHIALARRSRSRLAALPWYLRCLHRSPSFGLGWQGLASLPLPESARRLARVALGRPADWSIRQPAAAA